jgi:hypothetical protein
MNKLIGWIFLVGLGLGASALPASDPHRFQAELYGGFSLTDPQNLNAQIAFEKQYMNFWYNNLYSHFLNKGFLNSLEISNEGELRKMKGAVPLVLRLKKHIGRRFLFSLGCKTVYGRRSSQAVYHYDLGFTNGKTTTEVYRYEPIGQSAWGIAPMVGMHWAKPFAGKFTAEGYLCGGPLLTFCSIDKNFTYSIGPGSEASYETKMRGKGIGIAAEAGIQIRRALRKNWEIGMDIGYAYQFTSKLSGITERAYSDGQTGSWKGVWGMKSYKYDLPWANLDTEYISNNWEGEQSLKWLRGVSLDLSGFQIRIGMVYNIR